MDPTAFHTIAQLIRRGLFDAADAEEIAARLDDEGECDAARAVRAAVVEVSMPHPADERREVVVQMVPRLSLGPNGGKRPD